MQGDNHTDIVSRVKGELEARGVDLKGACGAFEITRRVAWALRGEGLGLLVKPGGENCDGFAAGYLVYRDGTGVDMLEDAGGKNGPQWNPDPPDAALAARWAPPVDTGDVLIPQPGPVPPAPAPPPNAEQLALEQKLFDAVARIYEGLDGLRLAIGELDRRLDTLQQHGIRLHF
jgi:hypothetical protein